MFSCSGCWDSPCRCGKEYQDWSIKDLQDQIKMLEEVLRKKIQLREHVAKRK